MSSFFIGTIDAFVTTRFRWKEFFNQLYFIANQSLFIIVFCVSFAAIVTVLESSFHMRLVVQNDSLVPGFAALLILREIGVIITALLLCSKVGAGYAAEVGTMKITEQLDALSMLNVNPFSYLVIPRLFASILGTMIVTVFANIACLIAAAIVTEFQMGYSANMFLTSMMRFVSFQDLILSVVKGGVFGAVIPLVACFFGFRCKQGAEGVGRVTTNTVVVSSILVIILDFILSYGFSYLY